ncbi:hypothetical protein HDU99_003599 [Rhizoclosmatium hyalinum]|nr:hypothetical protein HDU99_003599 [Rhizoclosmatium hyalinum]
MKFSSITGEDDSAADALCLTPEQVTELNGTTDIDEAFKHAKENGFTPAQTSGFLSIMKLTIKKITSEEKGAPPLKSLEKFRALVTANSGPTNGYDLFGPKESKLIVDFAMEGVFQHYKLYQYYTSIDQEIVPASLDVEVEEPIVEPQPLAEAMTLEAYEAELARLKELEELARLDRERWEAEERAAAANPFDVLSSEDVKQIATDTVGQMLKVIADELDGLLNEQGEKLMAQATKLSQLFPAAQ